MEFAILGPVEARADGAALPLGGPKQRALLAILLLHANEAVSRDRLIAGLWGDDPPPSAPQSLDSYVSRLRRVLGADRLVRRSPGYAVVVAPGELDLDRFEDLRAAGEPAAALGLWRGEALADVLYEPFANAEAERLEQRRLATLEERIGADLDAGAGAELVPELDALVAAHPLRERLLEQRMVALYRAGRQAEALAAMQDARHRLAGELGIEPGPQLRELERRILVHDPDLDAPRKVAPRTRRVAMVAVTALLVAGATTAGLLIAAGTGSSPAAATALSNRVVELDAGTGGVVRGVELPGAPAAAATAAGSLWVADPGDQLVLRVDPSDGRIVDRIPVSGQPGSVAGGGGSLWVTSTLGRAVERIDPATGGVTQTIRIPGANPAALAYRRGEVWVADPTSRSLVVIDARSGTVKAAHRVELRPTAIAAVGGAVWVAAHDDGAVTRVDPRSGRAVQTVRVGNGPAALAVADDALWVANSLDSTVSRVDPATGGVTATVAVGSGPVALAATGDALWVASQYAGRVTRIDPAANRAGRPIDVGGQPVSIAAADGRVWVGAGAAAASHRGGTLRLYMRGTPASFDPGLHYTIEALQYPRLAYDALVSLQVSPGPAGLRLVPDLAVALPTPSRGGTEYDFRLRPGIRYSDGRVVRAADFRRAIERLYRLGSFGTGYFDGVIGTEACGRAACDLARGIATDERTGSVTFHLRAPDPDFLYKLTVFSYAAPIPLGVPYADAGHSPVPGTGPYRVASFGGGELRLERNPYFREWSHAAQPAGNPDAILWRFASSFEAGARAVEDGRGDWLFGSLPPRRLAEIRLAHPAQVHANPSLIFEFLPLNTHVAPFDDVRVRRALNYAIDRAKLARMYGPGVGTPLCQATMPGLPGHVAYCPYPHDLARARSLVAASGTRGQRIDLWGLGDQLTIPRALPRYVASVLRSLGYRVRLHLVPGTRLTPALRRRIQISADGDWLADYPAPSAYLPQFFGCDGGLSNGYVCDRRLERLMARATRLQLSDPRRADAAWAVVDRRITDQALWVPTANLTAAELVSSRLRNYQFHPVWGFMADQAWLR